MYTPETGPETVSAVPPEEAVADKTVAPVELTWKVAPDVVAVRFVIEPVAWVFVVAVAEAEVMDRAFEE